MLAGRAVVRAKALFKKKKKRKKEKVKGDKKTLIKCKRIRNKRGSLETASETRQRGQEVKSDISNVHHSEGEGTTHAKNIADLLLSHLLGPVLGKNIRALLVAAGTKHGEGVVSDCEKKGSAKKNSAVKGNILLNLQVLHGVEED